MADELKTIFGVNLLIASYRSRPYIAADSILHSAEVGMRRDDALLEHVYAGMSKDHGLRRVFRQMRSVQ